MKRALIPVEDGRRRPNCNNKLANVFSAHQKGAAILGGGRRPRSWLHLDPVAGEFHAVVGDDDDYVDRNENGHRDYFSDSVSGRGEELLLQP